MTSYVVVLFDNDNRKIVEIGPAEFYDDILSLTFAETPLIGLFTASKINREQEGYS